MGTVDKQGMVTMQELLVSSLAQTDALVKLRKGFIGLMLPHFTACLITLATLTISSYASAEQKLVDLLFARDVVNSETVGPFEPGAYCEKEPEPSGPLPVIDSTTERKVFFWNLIESSRAGILRHTWYKGDAKVAEVDLRVGVSPNWRIWSSKKIVLKAHAGRWKVLISTVGEASEIICVAHFMVK
jgi:hypothetical protein